METIKSVGRSGQISLGKKYAGQTVLIDQVENGVWIIKLGRFIPENERWLYQGDIPHDLEEAIQWAEKNPPKKTNLKHWEAGVKE